MKKIYTLFSALTIAGLSAFNIAAAETQLQKPVVLEPTNVTEHGFTANWEKVDGAEAYCAFVYTEHVAKKDETFALIAEDFDLIDFGSVQSPVWSDELYEVLDIYTSLPNWSVYGYASYAQGMVGGVIYSPYFDARNNDGKYTVMITVYGNSGDVVYVHSEGTKSEQQSFTLTRTGSNTAVFEFTNGAHDTYFHINNTQGNDFFLDEAYVTQALKAGDKAYVTVDLNDAVMAENNSCDFKYLRFAKTATQVYYDVYAVLRVYNDPTHPDRYEQVYSPYSDKMVVNLKGSCVAAPQAQDTKVFAVENGLEIILQKKGNVKIYNILGQAVVNNSYAEGTHIINLPKGIYVVQIDGKSIKTKIK